MSRVLFLAAIDIFLRHTLCETQRLQEATEAAQRLGIFYYAGGLVYSCEELCKCLKNIAKEKNDNANKCESVYYELALVDRWNECITWSEISDKCRDPRDRFITSGSKCSGPWLSCLALTKQSAYCMANAMRVAKGLDAVLAADWVTVSTLADAAARQCALFHPPDIRVPEHRRCSNFPAERIEVCEMIIELLEKFPDIGVGDVEPIITVHKFKKIVAEYIMAAARSGLGLRSSPPALAHEYAAIYSITGAFTASLQRVYAQPYELLHEQEICQAKMVTHSALINTALALLAAVDSCSAFEGEWQSPFSELRKSTGTVIAQLAAVFGQLGPLNHPSDAAVTDQMSALSCRLTELLTAAQELKSKAMLTQKAACPRRTLAQLYDSKAAAALSVSPQSQYHVQLAQCWERAAALVRSATDGNQNLALAGKYAELAEGVLSSALICGNYRQYAAERGDEKLLTVWARLQVHTQTVSEQSMFALKGDAEGWYKISRMSRNRIIGAVHMAAQAMGALYGKGATSLQCLDADLQLCMADCSLISESRNKLHLLTVAQRLHGLVHAQQRHLVVLALPGRQHLQHTPALVDTLRNLVGHIYTLTDALAGGFAGSESGHQAWKTAVDVATRVASSIKRSHGEPTGMALAAHSVDLTMLAFQLCSKDASFYGALVQQAAIKYEGVTDMNDGTPPTQSATLTPEQRGRLRCFRLYHALRYELKVLLPLVRSDGLIAHFKALGHPSLDMSPIAGLPYAELVSKVVVASNNAVSCCRQARAVGTTENAGDLLRASALYAYAAVSLSQQAELTIVGLLNTVTIVAQVGAVAVSAKLALMSAKACEKAHNAVLAGNPEACALYRKAVATLPAPSDGAQLHNVLFQNAEAVDVLEKIARFYVHAADAVVHSKRDQSALWLEAAQIGERAFQAVAGDSPGLFTRLRPDWKMYVLGADRMAGKAAAAAAGAMATKMEK